MNELQETKMLKRNTPKHEKGIFICADHWNSRSVTVLGAETWKDQVKLSNDEAKKDFRAFPVRTLRASNETWKKVQKKRGGISWNKFLLDLIDKKK